MKRWISDPLFRRSVLLALAVGAGDGALGMLGGTHGSWDAGCNAASGIVIGAAAMRLWTWKEKP